MTDPTRDEVLLRRLREPAFGTETTERNLMAEAADILRALRERAEAAEKRAYELAVAIMGGEDAPGYADSIATQVLVDQQREMAREWMQAGSPAALTARLDAEWNAAIEAAATLAEHERDYGGRDQDGEFVCSEEAAIWGGNCAEVIRHGIRALRRAAPMEGEA